MAETPRGSERRQLAEYIGRRVREIREEKGKTPAEIAWAMKISRQALWMIERDGALQIDTLLKLSKALQVDLMDLLPPGYEDQLMPPPTVLEWYRRGVEVPADVPAEKRAGKQSNRRSSARSQEVEKRADQLSATVKQAKRNTAKRISKRCCTEPIPDQDELFCLTCGEAVYHTEMPLVAVG